MDILIKISQFILSFSLLVLIHEFGHFIVARIFRIRVEKFYIFFNPWFSIFKFKRGDTEYGMGWVPFGGYVKISGMIDESMDTDQMKEPPKPYEFRSKPAWQRLLVMLAGVIMNVVLAVFIYIGLSWAYGDEYIAAKDVTYGYVFNETGHKMGFRDGDKIIDIDGEPVGDEDYRLVLTRKILSEVGYMTVMRDGQSVRLDMPDDYLKTLIADDTGLVEDTDIRRPAVIGKLVKGDNAEKAGLMAGDSILSVDSMATPYFDLFRKQLLASAGTTVDVAVSRETAGVRSVVELAVSVSEGGTIGFYPKRDFFNVSTREYNLLQSIPNGIKRTGTEISDYAKQLKMIFSPKTEAYKQLGGIITIGSIFPEVWSWPDFWGLTAFFSIILAVINVIPIPGLDGGHAVFTLYEMITRRKPSDKFMEWVTTIGLLFIFALMIYATGNDIYRHFIK